MRPLTTAYPHHVESCIWVRRRNIQRPRTSGTSSSCTCCSGQHRVARGDRGQIDTETEKRQVQFIFREFKDFRKHGWDLNIGHNWQSGYFFTLGSISEQRYTGLAHIGFI